MTTKNSKLLSNNRLMEVTISKTTEEEIQALRLLFLHENNCQFIHNKCHSYGWCDNYIFFCEGVDIGYGAIWGKDKREDRDTIFEFYMLNTYRNMADVVFGQLIAVCKATFIECQTNCVMMGDLMYAYAKNINAEAILFKDHLQTNLLMAGTKLVSQQSDHPSDIPYILTLHDEEIADGGLMLNYNMPYADIYYAVKEDHRRKGIGTYMLQLLKAEAYALQRIPAARCNIRNTISKAALIKAGFKIYGHLLTGEIRKE